MQSLKFYILFRRKLKFVNFSPPPRKIKDRRRSVKVFFNSQFGLFCQDILHSFDFVALCLKVRQPLKAAGAVRGGTSRTTTTTAALIIQVDLVWTF